MEQEEIIIRKFEDILDSDWFLQKSTKKGKVTYIFRTRIDNSVYTVEAGTVKRLLALMGVPVETLETLSFLDKRYKHGQRKTKSRR